MEAWPEKTAHCVASGPEPPSGQAPAQPLLQARKPSSQAQR